MGAHAGATIQNVSCVTSAIEAWTDHFAQTNGKVWVNTAAQGTPEEFGHYVQDDTPSDNYHTTAGLAAYENGANTSVITSLVFTTIAMILGYVWFREFPPLSPQYLTGRTQLQGGKLHHSPRVVFALPNDGEPLLLLRGLWGTFGFGSSPPCRHSI